MSHQGMGHNAFLGNIGRPHSTDVWCPHDIGREVWEWVRTGVASYGKSELRARSARSGRCMARWRSGVVIVVVVVVVVVVECYCFLKIIIDVEGQPHPLRLALAPCIFST